MFITILNYLLCPDTGDELTLEQAKAKITDLESSNAKVQKSYDRVVNESGTFKSRAQEAESKLSDFEKNKAKSEGDLQKQLDIEVAEHGKTRVALKNTRVDKLQDELKVKALKFAKDAHDINVVLKIDQHKDLLTVDTEKFKISGVENYIKAVRKTHGYLFTKSKLLEQENKKGTGGNENDIKTDREKYSAELKECKTKKELDACKEKWADKKTWIKN